MSGYVNERTGINVQPWQTDVIADGYDPDEVHDTWIDPESLIPADWEGHER